MFKCIMPLSFAVFSHGRNFRLFTICKLCHWLHVKDVYSFLQMSRCVYLADVQLIVVCYAFSHTSVLGKTPKITKKFFENRLRSAPNTSEPPEPESAF